MKNKLIHIYIMIFTLLFCSIHCNNSSGFVEINKDTLKEYNEQFKYTVNSIASETTLIDFYLDLTFGLKIAFKDENTKAFFDNILNALKFNQIDFYSVANDAVKPFPNFNKTEIYNILNNPSSFTKAYAPLDLALKEILKNNTQAIYVTDGELWDKKVGESNRPWAREDFSEWLNRGNVIYFYITDHIDAGKQKHLFYMIFIPRFNLNNNITNDINFALKNNIVAKNLKYTPFKFGNRLYNLEQIYKNERSGGVDDILAVNADTYINDLQGSYEYAEYMISWEDIIEYIKNGVDDNNGNLIPGGRHLIRNLFINNADNEFYNIESLELKVYDMYEDYTMFTDYKNGLTIKPKFVTDQSGNKIVDTNDPDFEMIQQYYDEKGNFIESKKYKKKHLEEIKELFVLDEVLFSNTYKNTKRGEIGIKLHPNFNGSQISSERDNLFKIDIVVKNSIPITQDSLLNKFIWDGKKVPKNRAMYDSIINALNDANLKNGEIIYTYYVKTFNF